MPSLLPDIRFSHREIHTTRPISSIKVALESTLMCFQYWHTSIFVVAKIFPNLFRSHFMIHKYCNAYVGVMNAYLCKFE